MARLRIYRKTAAAACILIAFLFSGCKEKAALYTDGTAAAESPADEGGVDGTDGLSADTASDGADGTESLIYVYVCGEVANPGVYTLPEGSRVYDAIDAAGGMTEDAADDYLNLAELVSDGEKIDVPDVDEALELIEEEELSQSGLVNINTADADELMTLPGIGEAKAAAIISYREENGSFSSIEELMEISGIKEGVFNQIKDQITV